MTTIKLCFDNEIHRTQNLPADFKDFIKHIATLFQADLPENWLLQYVDIDGDKIMIADQKDYDEFKDLGHSSTTITKVYIYPVEGFGVNKFHSEEEIILSNDLAAKNKKESYEEIKVEEEKVDKEDQRQDMREEKKEEFDIIRTPGIDFAADKNNQVCVDASVLDELLSPMMNQNVPKEVPEQHNNSLSNEKISDAGDSQVVHDGIGCNGCGQIPIIGLRFKCTTCRDFNYCEKCEKAKEHSHNLLKMKHIEIQEEIRPVEPQVEVIQVNKPKDDKPRGLVGKVGKGLGKLIGFVKGSGNKDEDGEGEGKDKKEKREKKNKYYNNLMSKVKALKKQFPEADEDVLCAYVNEAPEDMNVKELIANYRI